jgi:hypothetical protein
VPNDPWIDQAHEWPVSFTPVFVAGEREYAEANGYTYGYASVYRPFAVLWDRPVVLAGSSHAQGAWYCYTQHALPVEKICRWQLVPVTQAARAALFGNSSERD